ncbi:hypothetical protein A1O1_01528 [Capronia coronata CBS 617.96]|uniref:Cytochrome c oxidase-assembly factor COX23, mitochondrial n=1 Tax=Capronia coronata CBS 617.96 TaxID=1182541 RepID=W9YU42_9EURO|nr:uncharacterized protein A1O1_01528 [Capronia coronata CBS 617.96]EXJ96402.1 hypothetical protein A1O1_01528 [Capronia coronata CBS 617.96]
MAPADQTDQQSGSVAQEDTWEKSKKTFEKKRSSEYYDPCQDFANRSIKCMHRNNGDRDMCQDYFQYVQPEASNSLLGSAVNLPDGP